MKIYLIALVASFAFVRSVPASREDSLVLSINEEDEPTTTTTVIPIIKDERVNPLNGDFNFDFETGDGIQRTESGSRTGIRKGVIRYPLPNGEIFELKFTAGPNGFQPESDYLPKAPKFPHPIPPHAQKQIDMHRG